MNVNCNPLIPLALVRMIPNKRGEKWKEQSEMVNEPPNKRESVKHEWMHQNEHGHTHERDNTASDYVQWIRLLGMPMAFESVNR